MTNPKRVTMEEQEDQGAARDEEEEWAEVQDAAWDEGEVRDRDPETGGDEIDRIWKR